MSFLNCACTKSHTHDSPANAPYSRKPHPLKSTNKDDLDSNGDVGRMMEYVADPSLYELYTVIGKGCDEAITITFTRYTPTGEIVAVKRVDLDHYPHDVSVLQNEIILSRQLYHENVLPTRATFVTNNEIWSILPIMAYGSCKDLLHAYFGNGLSELAVAYIMRDVIQGIEYLHSKGIIHRGIKASHILLSADGHVSLTGIRNAYSMIRNGHRLRTVHEYPITCVSMLKWFSPEILAQNLTGYDTKSDIYSIGITACELANGAEPFADMQLTQMLLEKMHGTKPVLIDCTTIADLVGDDDNATQVAQDSGIDVDTAKSRAEVVDIASRRKFSQHFHNFVDVCLEKDPTDRPTASSLLNHSFFKHLKKRSCDFLPTLVQPVQPLRADMLQSATPSPEDELVADLQNINVDDWEF
ncbi:STE20-related kinase adapter protein alpha-like isoform X1 [Mytilus edulis]|uniref:STE20-related kinase adapter protein alpha-like isoform X1 n=2 Tax=Mytilus edulis TaxID=6550 RepID=UPI0039F1380B